MKQTMKYPPRFFHDGLPDWKRKKDPILSRLIYRPLSFVTASLFCEVGWTANMVSAFSIVIGIAIFCCFSAGFPIAGALLLNIWLVLDCTDGNIARCVNAERYGDFIDGIAGYICSAFTFAGLGICVFLSGGIFITPEVPFMILLGCMAALCEALSRLIHQKYTNTAYEQGAETAKNYDPDKATGLTRLRMKVDQFLSIGGVLPAVVLVASIARALDIVLFVWGAYYIAAFAFVTGYYVRKTVFKSRG